jgi:cardiolipin synthase
VEDISVIIKNWKKEIFTIPNLLSLFRLLLIPVYVNIYLKASEQKDYLLAGFVLAVSCLTDMFDGKLARKLNMVSNFGKLLDPMADKLTQLAITVCLSQRYHVLKPVLVLFLIKEIFQLVAVILNFRKGKALDGALMAGKICTTVLFTGFTLLVLIPNMNPAIVDCIALTDCVCLLFAFVHYIFAFFGKHAQVHDIEK